MSELPINESIRLAREHFFNGCGVPSGLVSGYISRSWQRCAEQGLSARQAAEPLALSAGDFAQHQADNRRLINLARPEMENLYRQLSHARTMITLTDTDATILAMLGDQDFLVELRGKSICEGMRWDEATMGTNALGTTVIEQRPLIIHGAEHYLERNALFTCSAAPIHDPAGRLLGVIDISADHLRRESQTLALLTMSVRMIENRLFFLEYGQHFVLRFHSRPEFLHTLWEGITVFDGDGTLVAANEEALTQLGLTRANMAGQCFSSLFDSSLPSVLRDGNGSFMSSLTLREGGAVYGLMQSPRPQAAPVQPRPAPAAAAPDLLRQAGEDPAMERQLLRAARAFAARIPVVIQGETGTGKELLAQALHRSGSRPDGAFVAVNCAAIPEGLIESELFGYRDGAFTGARKGGHAGRILQAHGGTLFLDEIGDMPLALQARLLRVLQEREVLPLGADKAIPVDIDVICATHHQLSAAVTGGRFRQDLYFRLNGLRVELPPLRKRSNFAAILEQMLADLGAGDVRLTARAQQAVSAYEWPGNLRELHSVLRTALVLCDGNCIDLEDLPEELLGALHQGRACVREATALAAPATDLESMELDAIRHAIDQCAGNISEAAQQLGISRATIYRKLKNAS
jgi:transcriptional regulator of acetoin/glycerol metabolism